MEAVDLEKKFAEFDEYWQPKIVGELNGQVVKLAKLKGDFIWHHHENEDELFQVLKGTLLMQFRDRTEIVKEGEIIVVPKGVEHCPKTNDEEEVHLLLFEKISTAHTGEVVHEKTQNHYPKI